MHFLLVRLPFFENFLERIPPAGPKGRMPAIYQAWMASAPLWRVVQQKKWCLGQRRFLLAAKDIRHATAQMASYIRHSGFGERISHVDVSTQVEEGINTDVASTNVEIEAGLVAPYQRARVILEDNHVVFLKMVNALRDAGELGAEQIRKWVGLADAPPRHVLEPYEAKLEAFVQRSAANRASVQRRA